MADSAKDRLNRAYISLAGLALGDSFGDQFFIRSDLLLDLIENRALPGPIWKFTDDTNMALSIVSVLRQFGHIEQDRLARSFAEHYELPRKYGYGMHRILPRIRDGEPWQSVTGNLFEGHGSYGNGAAMRVAPLGAYFADNLNAVVAEASLSAEVTHSHPEGIAGAIAVAVAAALACEKDIAKQSVESFLDRVQALVPESEVRSKIQRARDFPPGTTLQHAVAVLGNGESMSAQDTVPFALWCAAQHLNNYEEALWLTVSGLGDRDTTCAIVGGIVAIATGIDGMPEEWRQSSETLPAWHLEEITASRNNG